MNIDDVYYYGQGVECLEKGNFEGGLEYFYKSLEQKPHFKTYERIYHCLKHLGRNTEACEYIERAFNLNNRNDKVAVEYASELIVAGQLELASNILSDIIQRNSHYGPALRLLKSLQNNDD